MRFLEVPFGLWIYRETKRNTQPLCGVQSTALERRAPATLSTPCECWQWLAHETDQETVAWGFGCFGSLFEGYLQLAGRLEELFGRWGVARLCMSQRFFGEVRLLHHGVSAKKQVVRCTDMIHFHGGRSRTLH